MSEVWHKHMYVNDETYVRDPHTNFHSPLTSPTKSKHGPSICHDYRP